MHHVGPWDTAEASQSRHPLTLQETAIQGRLAEPPGKATQLILSSRPGDIAPPSPWLPPLSKCRHPFPPLPETDEIMHPAQSLCTRMATGN